MSDILLRRATKEQLSHWAHMSNKLQSIARMMQEPPIYRPVRDLCAIDMSVSFQTDIPIFHTMELYSINGRIDSFRAVIDGKKQHGRGGWHKWYEEMAKVQPYGMGVFYGER